MQNAYEVLSDPHERAFYDSHRASILGGGGGGSGGGRGDGGGGGRSSSYRPDSEVDLWGLFSSAAFSGYGDDGRGFYA
eukprot:SM009560S24922  [mRNA]  locus=s9560:247:477:+ [translate_table: standard]